MHECRGKKKKGTTSFDLNATRYLRAYVQLYLFPICLFPFPLSLIHTHERLSAKKKKGLLPFSLFFFVLFFFF